MNRILAVVVGLAFVVLVGFAIVVFTTGGPPPAVQPGPTSQADAQAQSPTNETTQQAAAPEPATEMAQQTPEAAERFEAWAKALRDGGLTVTAGRVAVAGETISVTDLTIAGPPEPLSWRWTSERASLYDRELFHLQAAGKTAFVLVSGQGQETAWTGRADAIGIAITRDLRDKLGRTAVVRINGLSLAREGDAAPFTLSDGQLRILLKGGTGILPQGTDLTLRLTDVTLPSTAATTVGSRLKSFTTEFPIDRSITAYSLQQVIDFFRRGVSENVDLGMIAADWGALHFIGDGAFGLGSSGEPRGRFAVKVTDVLTLLDAIAAAGGPSAGDLPDQYASLLLAIGGTPGEAALPMTIVISDGAILLEWPGGAIPLGTLPRLSGGDAPASPTAAEAPLAQ